MGTKLWDIIIVGGGPAGISAALRLAREDLDVLVVEAAVYPGAENWSGAVYFAENLAAPELLGPDELEAAPYERRVVKRGFFVTQGPSLAGIEYRNPETFRYCYTVLRPVYDRYLAERARQLGVTLLNSTTVDGLIRDGGRVVGVHTDRGPLYGRLVFLAEGDASHLTSKEGFESDAVRSKKSGQPAFLQGVKEVIQLDARTIEDRFGVGPGEGCCYEVLLRNGVASGRPIRPNMAGFIYTNRSSLSIGLVLPLENLASVGGDYNALMEWFKGLPAVRRWIDGGESVSYGAKIIRGSGLRELPRLVDHGVAIGGAATGIGIDFPYPNYTGPATAMGRLFAEAALQLLRTGEDPTAERLARLYVEPLRATHYYRNVEHLRDWPEFIEHTQTFFGRQVDLINGVAYALTRNRLGPLRKWWEAVGLADRTLRGKWRQTIADVHHGSKALRIGRYVLKHVPVALLASIPNTIAALWPRGSGSAPGELRFRFWVEAEPTGSLPAYLRWLGRRLEPGLARAAHALYANDDRAVGAKLDRGIGTVLRRLSLWDLLIGIVTAVALPVTALARRVVDRLRSLTGKPANAFYERWHAGWRELTDLSPHRLTVRRTHDAKLGDVSYLGEPHSHIKVFFPPARRGTFEEPARSSLWTVCPAAVYQVNLDRTLHAAATVNFENCVKCETCWRIEPGHVDWTRFGRHRLVYEVYTEADAPLRRILLEREGARTAAIAASYWSVRLDGAGDEGERGAEDGTRQVADTVRAEGLDDAVRTARRALTRVRAGCEALHAEVWEGPRVLEPGQVAWLASTVDYLAALTVEAARAARMSPIRAAAGALGLGTTLERLVCDLEGVADRARAHAGRRRFFAAEADARQIRDHHLGGLSEILDRIDGATGLETDRADSIEALRELETAPEVGEHDRVQLRGFLAETFDRASIRRLEHGGDLQPRELDVLQAAARAARGLDADASDFDGWARLERNDLIGELSRVDPSLAAVLAGHLAGLEALERAGAPASVIGPYSSADRMLALALEAEATPGRRGWTARIPFVLTAGAGGFLVRGGGRLALFLADEPGVELSPTPAIGLIGARPAELRLHEAIPTWEGSWSEDSESALFAVRARDLVALALGAGALLAERAVEHARSRIQFPDHFQDLDGRDAVGKFGAVRAHLAEIELYRLAVETMLHDTVWTDETGADPARAKAMASSLFGPALSSISYQTGQVIGGTAFSEDDIFSKLYRDSSVFPHYVRANDAIFRALGARSTADLGEGATVLGGSQARHRLVPAEGRPILDVEVKRLDAADARLTEALRVGLDAAGDDPSVIEAVQSVAGELATRLHVWAQLLARAHRRLEAALPAERYVEATRLWADRVEERLVEVQDELRSAPDRIDLGALAFEIGDHPDEPIATTDLEFDYERDIAGAARSYRSGSFLLEPPDPGAVRYVPELVWADDVIRGRYEEYLRLFRERFVEPGYDPPFDRHIERLHYIPRGHIDWTREQGFLRVVIPEELGGQGRWKADYYNLCMISKRLADVSHTLTIQANTSIGTTPILLGLYQDIPAAERDLRRALAQPQAVERTRNELQRLIERTSQPDFRALQSAFGSLYGDVRKSLGRSRILKKAVFGALLDRLDEAARAGRAGDLPTFRAGLEAALDALDGWRERARTELEEIPRRQLAHEFFLQLISARMISAFALTEPSAGSDTARIRTEARLDRRRLHTDPDGVRFFYVDEEARAGRRNFCDMTRFEFDGSRILYRYRDDAEPAEVRSHEYSYTEDTEKYRYYMHGDRRVDIHDIGMVRSGDDGDEYEFYVLNGAKMWITNGHIAGVMSLYARTPLGPTGFMVDTHAEGFLVGKDEEKTGQRGSPTNEITLTNVRVPRECMIGIDGRGQENALETLNVGRAGLGVSSTAGIQQAITDARDHAGTAGLRDTGWARYRLGLALEEMFAIEAICHHVIGLFDDGTTDALRMECAIAKYHGTEGLHRVLEYLEPIYGVEGQTHRHRIEKDRRDARVMTIYEGTNEIQQFLLLKDLIDMIGPQLEGAAELRVAADGSPHARELETLESILNGLRERLHRTRRTFGSAAWQRALMQPVFFRLARMAVWTQMVESAIHRGHFVATRLVAEGDSVRRRWCALATRGFVARGRREFARLAAAFDREFQAVATGDRPADLRLAEIVLDTADADEARHRSTTARPRLPRPEIERDVEIVVALEYVPRLAPRPRLENGRLAEHVHGFSAGGYRALRLALALKSANPDHVRLTLVSAAPRHADEALRAGLAAGADRAILLDTRGEAYTDHAVARAIADLLRDRRIEFDLLLTGGSQQRTDGSALAGRLAAELELDWIPSVADLWIDGTDLLVTGRRFAEGVRTPTPVIVAAAPGDEREPEFATEGFLRALRRPLEVLPFPSAADRSDERLVTAASTADVDDEPNGGQIDPTDAAEVLARVGELTDGGGPVAEPYRGAMRDVGVDAIDWGGVTCVAEFQDGDLARSAVAALEAARALAANAGAPLTGLVLSDPLDEHGRRELAGRLLAHAPFTRLVFAEHPGLSSAAARAGREALVRLLGPAASTRPAYLVTSTWLAEALPAVAQALRDAGIPAEELGGVSRIEFSDGRGVSLERTTLDPKLRARRVRPACGDGLQLVCCEAEVSVDGGEPPAGEPEVVRVELDLEYDPQTDRLARALADARKELDVVTLDNAEFIIDVGAGLGSGENLETVVEPLRQALLELGAPHVEIGASRKVTQDLNWLPDDRQIGQTGVRVNPRVLIALGISGAPQHLDYIGDRAVIFAFNLDSKAPIMTLNQRRPRPRVYPVTGDLFETVPKFLEALRAQREGPSG